MRPEEVVMRADNYREMFWHCELRTNKKDRTKNEWVRVKPHEWATTLIAAKTEDEVARALDWVPEHVQNKLRPLASLILLILEERGFPKRPENQLDFVADSLAGLGEVSPRRSRDVCAQERAQQLRKSPHRILRREYYVECSCGYKGPARNDACRNCGAKIIISLPEGFAGF